MGGRREISYRISKRVLSAKIHFAEKSVYASRPRRNRRRPAAAAPVKSRNGVRRDQDPKTARFSGGPASQSRAWVSKFNPVSIWRGARPATPQKAQRPLQAELSLDRVKVVHNDLERRGRGDCADQIAHRCRRRRNRCCHRPLAEIPGAG